MKKNEKSALLALMGGAGLIILLVGAMTNLYDTKYGFLGALTLWILAGVLAKYLGVKKKRR